MIEHSVSTPSFLEERQQFWKRSYKALQEMTLMAHVCPDPDEVSFYLDQAKAIGHIRFSLWMDLHGIPPK